MDLYLGPQIVYFFTAAWDLLVQKTTSAKLKVLHIHLFSE